VQKVKQIFGLFGTTPKARKCAAILGIIKEAEEIVLENKKFPTINAAIIFASQKAEHYEIASYGTLREWARQLNNATAVSIIDEILDEEKAANNRLTSLAEKHCNLTADSGSFDREVVGHAS
jgi:ferritin-like metal-binding protein YciE